MPSLLLSFHTEDRGRMLGLRREMEEEVDGVVVTETAANSNTPLLSFPTLLKMLQQHPRFVVRKIQLCLSLSEFREKYGPDTVTNKLRIVAADTSDPSKGILAIFCTPKAVSKVNEEIRSFASLVVNKQGLSASIMVSLQIDQITSQAAAMKATEVWPFKVEVYQITDLLVNVTKHAPLIKPKPHLLTNEEKINLLKKRYSIQENQLILLYISSLLLFCLFVHC